MLAFFEIWGIETLSVVPNPIGDQGFFFFILIVVYIVFL